MSLAQRGIVGRADLLRVLAVQAARGDAAMSLAELAALMELEITESGAEEKSVARRTEPTDTPSDLPGSVPPAVPVSRKVAFWQPRTLVWREKPTRDHEGGVDGSRSSKREASEKEPLRPRVAPVAPLLSTRRRLLPMLERSLVGELRGEEVDVDELVYRVGRGVHVAEIPRLRRRGWPTLVLVVDRDFGLVPFWGDQRVLERWLLSILGRSALVVRYVDELGPEDGVLDSRGRSVSLLDGAIAGLPVLALTDLGWYRGLAHQRAWLRVGRRLRRAGQRIHALVPVPATRWTRALARVWSPMPWERPTVDQGDMASEPDGRRARVERLLAMAACAHRLEPGLLRELRLSLPREAADVGTEADAWLHEDTAGCFPSATVVRSERVEALRAKLTKDDAARVRDALRAWHWHRGRQPELWHSEALSLERTMPGIVGERDRERAEAFVEQLGERALQAVLRGDDAPARLREWLDYVEARVPREVWSADTRAGRGLQIAWWATHGDRPPPDPDPSLRALVRSPSVGVPRGIGLWHVGRRLGAGSGPSGAGSPVVVIEAADERAYVVRGNGTSFPVDVSGPEWIEGRARAGVELRTDRVTLRLEALEKPDWASAIGRDRFGLWAELRVGEVGVRMRWIAPGRFVMGSPEDEPQRADWEGPQHEVVITRGFWMGETPVTQALWEAVTGENPSHFKGSDRPVESVSWEDCHEILEQLNETITEDRDGRFRLPTEAEWEYACRACTETATYAGPIEIRGERNAPVLDEISWYGGNSGVDYEFDDGVDSSGWEDKQYPHTRAGTRRVGEKLPNQWGLHDMLGNVWEWCSDCWNFGSPYSSEPQQDPSGPATGEGRVCRGGSWLELAWYVRAAYRFGSGPGYRYQYLGLRLVRGQAVQRPGGPDPAGPEGPGRGRGAEGGKRARSAAAPRATRRRRTVR